MSEYRIRERDVDRPQTIRFSDECLHVELVDGRIISTPLRWYPKLMTATDEQRNDYDLSSTGVHWDNLDEDLSVRGMLKGSPSIDYRLEKALSARDLVPA